MLVKIIKNIAIIFLVFSILVACSAETSNSKKKENADSTHNVNELIYAASKDMPPHLYTGSMPAQGMVYESLVENTEDGIKPLLAESWEVSEDGRVYTFHLRKDV